MNILQAKNLNKIFTEPTPFQALKDVSFDVKQGEFLSIVGKSGCGKSTLLYLLSTMDTDYEGEIVMNNERLTGKSQNELSQFRNLNLGFVFQFHYLLPEFTALENVMLPALKLRQHSQKEVEERAYQKLKLFGLEDQAMKPSNKLSGGQQQRVAIARALINDPLIIMGDEPTGNLDHYNTDLVFDIFRQLARENKQTIIAVTHDNDFAKASDRVIEMSDGQIISS